jgi:hypothetical protein
MKPRPTYELEISVWGSDLEKAPAAIPPVLEDLDDHSLGCAEGLC